MNILWSPLQAAIRDQERLMTMGRTCAPDDISPLQNGIRQRSFRTTTCRSRANLNSSATAIGRRFIGSYVDDSQNFG